MGVWTGTVPTFKVGPIPAADLQTMADIHTALTAAWTTWVPILTNITAGNGVQVAKYRQLGKTVDYRWKFRLGTTSAIGTAPRFTLPVAPHAEYVADEDRLGTGQLLDAATQLRDAIIYLISGSTVEIAAFGSTGSKASITSLVPWTWGTSDTLMASGTYEAA